MIKYTKRTQCLIYFASIICQGVVLSDSFAVDSPSSTAYRSVWLPWLVCLSAGLFFLYVFFQLNVFDVINESLRQTFHIDAAKLSWMSSMFVWANVLFLLPAGIILDRYSARWVILVAMTACVVGTIGFAYATSFYWACFFHAVTGASNAFCFLSCVVLVTRWFPPRRQALVIGCIVTMAFLGGMMAHTPLAYLNDAYGWRHAVLIDGIVGVFILLWMMMAVRDKPCDRASAPHLDAWVFHFKQALLNRQNWFAGLYTACLNLPIMVLCALWGDSYLQMAHHLTHLGASNIVSLIFIGSIVGCPLVGWLSDSLGRRKPLMVVGAILTFLTVIPLFVGIALSETVLGILFFLLGLFTSTQVISYPLIAESNRMQNTGIATGMASVIIMGLGGVGQVMFGVLMQRHASIAHSSYTTADFQFAMWMFPITAVVALLSILLTRETYCRQLG